MKIFVAVVMSVISFLGMEPQAWLLQDRQGTNFAEPQIQSQGQQQSSGDVSPLLNTKPSAGTSQGDCDQHDESNHPPGQMDYLSYWLAALTLVQAVILFFQTVYTRNAADAAKASAQVARDALSVVERPSLAPEKWEFGIDGNANAAVDGIICTLRNTGRTRATVIEGGISFVNWEKTPPRNVMADFWIPQEGIFTVHPQEVLNYVLSFSAEEHKQIRKAGGSLERMYYYGRISYTDDFYNLHHLRFCIFDFHGLVPVKEGNYNYTETVKKEEEKQPTWYERVFRRRLP